MLRESKYFFKNIGIKSKFFLSDILIKKGVAKKYVYCETIIMP